MKSYLTESIGAFFLTLTVTLAGRNDLAPLAVAFVLMILVYTGGYISGAHYNPAVTTALAWSRLFSIATVLPYVIVQILGAFLGAVTAYFLSGERLAPTPIPGGLLAPLIAEILFTALLCYTVIHTAAVKENQSNQYYGLAIGAVLLVGAIIAGPISGGVLNPAIGIAAVLASLVTGAQVSLLATFLYIVGPIAGAMLAATVYSMQRK